MARYPSLDYLRGWMALAVLIFHFDKWLSCTWVAASIQGRLGVYAVSAFFVLSGLTLSLVYASRLTATRRSWLAFFKKRIYRIFPLLWVATLATLILDHSARSGTDIFLNFSGLFGFVNPARDIPTGAWSIGCELVYYAAFPTLLLVAQLDKKAFLAIFILLFGFGVWYAFNWFSIDYVEQSNWWEAYVQAANDGFFFAGGMAIGLFQDTLSKLPRRLWIAVLVLSSVLFASWPIGNLPFELVSGWNRVGLSVLVLLAITAWFNSGIEWTGWAQRLFLWLGAVSYSLYLLHPLVFRGVRSLIVKMEFSENYYGVFSASLIATCLVSHLSYYYFERFFLKKA